MKSVLIKEVSNGYVIGFYLSGELLGDKVTVAADLGKVAGYVEDFFIKDDEMKLGINKKGKVDIITLVGNIRRYYKTHQDIVFVGKIYGIPVYTDKTLKPDEYCIVVGSAYAQDAKEIFKSQKAILEKYRRKNDTQHTKPSN